MGRVAKDSELSQMGMVALWINTEEKRAESMAQLSSLIQEWAQWSSSVQWQWEGADTGKSSPAAWAGVELRDFPLCSRAASRDWGHWGTQAHPVVWAGAGLGGLLSAAWKDLLKATLLQGSDRESHIWILPHTQEKVDMEKAEISCSW